MQGKYVESYDRVKIFYERNTGKDPGFVFIHGGFFGNRTTLKRLYSNFSEYNFVVPDLRGRGKSFIKNEKEITLESYARDIYEICQHEKFDEIILVGISFGSLVSAKFADMFGEKIRISKVVLISPTYCPSKCLGKRTLKYGVPIFRKSVQALQRLFSGREPSTNCNADYSKLGERFFNIKYARAQLRNNSLKKILDVYEFMLKALFWNGQNSLKKIRAPTLIIYGEKDKLIHMDHIGFILHAVPGSFLKTIPDYGHNIYMHRVPRVMEYITEFVQ